MQDNAPELEGISKTADGKTFADEVTQRACQIVANCNRFKQPRLDRIALYRELYAGKARKKFRQPFNVVLPVFAGAMDTLAAEFNDDLSVDITHIEPADYIAIRKLNALWKQETGSVAPNAKFAYKTRTDRHNALFSGRGFMMNYAVSKPKFQNNFETFELEDAIFMPQGGGLWPLHLASGRQNVIRSQHELESGDYDQAQVKKLISNVGKADYLPPGDEHTRNELAKFKAMGLSAEANTYVGEQLFRLVELRINVHGKRWYLLFSPYYNTWVRLSRFSEMFSADIDPWTSWATHEDNKNFLPKSFADDLYGVAEATHTLFNQDLVNREKQNFHPRAYDKEMFPDVQKLDQAQYRPDALVPADTKGGVRRISEGIFTFETPQLSGTIDLINWMNDTNGRAVGVSDTSQGSTQGTSKKATVVLADQQNISKRILLRSASYTEATGETAKIFVQGAKDHLPAKLAIKRLGVEGEGWEPVIRRVDLDLYGDIDVKITSSSVEMRNSQLKKEARKEVLDTISADPAQASQVNPRWLVEEKLRSVAEFDDAEIAVAMDTKNYGNKEEVAYAHRGIQAILNKEKPDLFYGATTLFMRIIYDYAVNNRVTLGDEKYGKLLDYQMAHAEIVRDNMARKAAQDAAMQVDEAITPGGEPPPAQAPESPQSGTMLDQVRNLAPTV